jgi:cell division protein FtsB
MDGEIFAMVRVASCAVWRPFLTHDDFAGVNPLAAETLYAEALAFAIPIVLRRPAGFLCCHSAKILSEYCLFARGQSALFGRTMPAVPYRDIAPFSKQVTILIGLCVVAAMSFGLALSYYNNILFDRRLDLMAQQNQKLKDQITAGYKQLEYLQSAQYKDKYAKENLNKVKTGEKVLIITTDSLGSAQTAVSEDKDAATERQAFLEQRFREIPIIEHWKLFLFDREKLARLKNSLTLEQ